MTEATATPKFTPVIKEGKIKRIFKAIVKHTSWQGFCYFCFAVSAAATGIYAYIDSQKTIWQRLLDFIF